VLFLVITVGEVIAVAPLILEALYLTVGIHVAGGSDLWTLGLLFVIIPATELGAASVYWVGRAGRGPIAKFIFPLLRIERKQVHVIQRWMYRAGPWPIALGRAIPGFVIPISFLCGVLHVPYKRFFMGVLIQSVGWAVFFIVLGAGIRITIGEPGPNDQLNVEAFKIGLVVLLAIGVGGFLAYLKWGPKGSKEKFEPESAAEKAVKHGD
jgi:membrane protein DedA with SNARE-associated domain